MLDLIAPARQSTAKPVNPNLQKNLELHKIIANLSKNKSLEKWCSEYPLPRITNTY